MSDSTYDAGKDFISVLLVGKTGDGKSSTCNTIIGQKKFQSKRSFSSTTKKCQKEVVRVEGHNLVVVDSPGLADTDITADGGLEQLGDEIVNIFATEPDGFDVILIVVSYGRKYTKEDKQVFQELHLLFGKEYVMKRGILLVTHEDKYDPKENDNLSIHQFMKNQKGLFSEMLKQCNNRVVYFDNDTKDESVRQEQVKQLLDIAVKSKRTPLGVTPELIVKAQEVRNEVNRESKKAVIDKDTLKGLWLLIYSLETINNPDCRDVKSLETISELLQETWQELTDQDKGTGRLKDVIASVSRLEEACKMRIVAIEKDRHIDAAIEGVSREINALKMLLEKSVEAQLFVLEVRLQQAFKHFLIDFYAHLLNPEAVPRARETCGLQ